MVDFHTIAFFVLGVVALVLGAEWLVRGAARLAAEMGISPLAVGLTVVAYGTSAPELAVSLSSAFKSQPDIALGNVVGSNLFNIMFILGASALIVPLVVHSQLIRKDVPILIAASVAVLAMALDGSIGRIDGAVLFFAGVAYTIHVVHASRRETRAALEAEEEMAEIGLEGPLKSRPAWNVCLVLAGLGMLVLGSDWLVESAVIVARSLGISELVIGLTMVALGTSLPEVFTSIIAAVKGERDIAVGNAVGSSIFNIVVVLGLTGLLAPAPVPVAHETLLVEVPLMIASAALCLPIFYTGYLISRLEGIIFLGCYGAYIAYLTLDAKHSSALATYSIAAVAVAGTIFVALSAQAIWQWHGKRSIV